MSDSTSAIELAVREALRDHGRLTVDAHSIDRSANLYEGGMTSQASVNVMLALEGRFDLEFPDAMLSREVFASIANIAAALVSLGAQP
jgi:acyl carrier protein